MALISGRGNSINFQDFATGKIIRYIPRDGVHPKTGKPLSDILILEDNLGINWPKITDKDTGEVRPWDFFDGEIDLGVKVEVGWKDGNFSCTILS